MANPVLLFQLGEAPETVLDEHGGYHRWFEAAWGGPLARSDGRAGGPPPDARDWAAIIVSGSPSSLAEPEPWMEVAAEVVREARQVGTPLFGVCFGHQLIGHAAGGRVVVNPSGWEVGTCEVDVHEAGRADPLFEGLPPTVRVNLTHRDAIDPATLPADVRVLAGNAATPVQAVAWGEHIRGVQFHPEIDGPIARGYIHARRARLAPTHDPDDLIARTTDAPHAVAVLQNFKRRYVR